MIDNKLKDKIEEVKSEVKIDIEQLQSKLDTLEKTVVVAKESDDTPDSRTNCLVIKNF